MCRLLLGARIAGPVIWFIKKKRTFVDQIQYKMTGEKRKEMDTLLPYLIIASFIFAV